jgi:hypothetical protein
MTMNKSNLQMSNVVGYMLEKAPGLRAHVDSEFDDSPYVVFGNVALYLREPTADATTVIAVYRVIEDLANCDDPAIDDLLLAGFFETLLGGDRAAETAFERLHGRAVDLLRTASR